MRLGLVLIALTALPAVADDFIAPAPISAATVYPQGASITRDITLDLPAGAHRILVPITGAIDQSAPPRIEGAGAFTIGAVEYLDDFVSNAALAYTPAQSAAKDAVNAAAKAVAKIEETANGAIAERNAIDAQIAFFQSISAASLDTLDPDALVATGILIAQQLQTAFAAKTAAQDKLKSVSDALEDARSVLAQAQLDFQRLTPPTSPVDMLGVSLNVDGDQTVTLSYETLLQNSGWRADYEMDLTTGDAAKIDVERKVVVFQSTGQTWTNVDLTLSTANPFASIAPQPAYPNLARLFDPKAATKSRSASDAMEPELSMFLGGQIDETAPAPVIQARMQLEGDVVTYAYPTPVTVTGAPLTLSLGAFDTNTDIFNRASPRYDQTAFLMAKFINDGDEPLLPGGVSLSRDGTFIGRTTIALIPAGAEAELSFGPIEGMRLSFKALKNDTGDRGLITTSNTRRQLMEFSVENLTDQTETVQTLFALPYSEQEDLVVDITAQPRPDVTDFEDARGVGEWSLDVAPGETQTVEIAIDLAWPQGGSIEWQP